MMNGFLGHVVDVLGVVATILGVSVTIGFGVSRFIDGLYAITGITWIMDLTGDAPVPSVVGLLVRLVVIMGLSIISAVSGVGKGGKIPLEPKLSPIIDLIADICCIWVLYLCNDNICDGVG